MMAFTTGNNQERTFFHVDFHMAAVAAAGSFGVSFGLPAGGIANATGMPKTGILKRVSGKVCFMKKIFVSVICLFSIITSTFSQRVCGPEFAPYGLEGKTYEEAIDWAGDLHNEYQKHMLNFLITSKPDFQDTTTLKEIIFRESIQFFNDKGLNYDSNQYPITFGAPISRFTFQIENFSEEANAILRELNDLINSYDPMNDTEFFTRLNELKESALMLQDEKEVFITGVPVSIALHSYPFWKKNGQNKLDILTNEAVNESDSGHGPSMRIYERMIFKKCNIHLGSLAGTDVSGAYTGAVAGAVLGPGGSFAGAVVVSASASLLNISTQVIGCLFGWW